MTYTMTPRELPLNADYDVIVVGGGPAGVCAAYAAAREGAKTLVIEQTGALGGMSTMGMVPAWCPFSDKEKIIYRGLAQRIFELGKKETPFVDPDMLDWVPIEPESMKRIYDELLAEVGADVLYGTVLSDADVSEGKIRALIVSNKAGLSAYAAKTYVDCTGDGDLAAFAGAEFHMGRDDDPTDTQEATHCFALGGVNMEAYAKLKLNASNKASPIFAIRDDPKYPRLDTHCCDSVNGEGIVGFNAGHLTEVNGTDPLSLSRAYPRGRRLAHEMSRALAEYCPEAFGKCFVAQTAPLMGIRETRRIVGDYTLTVEDYMSRASFPDEIARNSYFLDIHRTKKELEELKKKPRETADTDAEYGKGESHGIPYRCLTPKGLENLLVAGRIISCDRRILGSVRVMPNCLTTGEAAGLAAATSAREGVSVHGVDTEELRAKLRSYGAYFL